MADGKPHEQVGQEPTLDPQVENALDRIQRGSLSMADLARILARQEETPLPAKLPLPAEITPEQHKALAHIHSVFGVIVPERRRTLTETEVATLYDERKTLDVLEKMIKSRREDIRTTILNHLDVQYENENNVGVVEGFLIEGDSAAVGGTERDIKGHYLASGQVPVSGASECFSWEVSDRQPSIDPVALKRMAEDPDNPLTHEDWLSCTETQRVFSPEKFMLHMKRRPGLLAIVAKAAKSGTKRGALYLRKK